MSGLRFSKMHGLGNDFVVLDARNAPIDLSSEQIEQLADRRTGIGFDQLVRIDRSSDADATLTFFNADGSEAEACGNATRGVGRLLLLEMDKAELVLDTDGGQLHARRSPQGLTTVDMPEPRTDWWDIPLAEACDTLAVPLDLPGLARPCAVNMGNPHVVFFVDDVDGFDIVSLARRVQADPLFPQGVNVGFAQQIDAVTMRLRVYERGAGLTRACGSGACAAMVAGRWRGLLGDRATLMLDGGALEIAWNGSGPVEMTGATAFVYTGLVDDEQLDA